MFHRIELTDIHHIVLILQYSSCTRMVSHMTDHVIKHTIQKLHMHKFVCLKATDSVPDVYNPPAVDV